MVASVDENVCSHVKMLCSIVAAMMFVCHFKIVLVRCGHIPHSDPVCGSVFYMAVTFLISTTTIIQLLAEGQSWPNEGLP